MGCYESMYVATTRLTREEFDKHRQLHTRTTLSSSNGTSIAFELAWISDLAGYYVHMYIDGTWLY